MSFDGRKIFYVPTAYIKQFGIMQYNIETGEITSLSESPVAVYTGNGIMDSKGRLFFTKFGNASVRAGLFQIYEITIEGTLA